MYSETDGSICEGCAEGYDLSFNRCVVAIENCTLYSKTDGSICEGCAEGYDLADNMCSLIDLCVTYSSDNENRCLECKRTTWLLIIYVCSMMTTA